MIYTILSWVIPIAVNVGVGLFIYWIGYRSGKKNADWGLWHQLKTLQANYDWLKDYSDQQDKKLPKDHENVPVIYYFESGIDQYMHAMAGQYALSLAELPTIFEAECILEKKEPKKIDKLKKA